MLVNLQSLPKFLGIVLVIKHILISLMYFSAIHGVAQIVIKAFQLSTMSDFYDTGAAKTYRISVASIILGRYLTLALTLIFLIFWAYTKLPRSPTKL